eukprot:7885839-Lingulodinium_polyedra.AAC.1
MAPPPGTERQQHDRYGDRSKGSNAQQWSPATLRKPIPAEDRYGCYQRALAQTTNHLRNLGPL